MNFFALALLAAAPVAVPPPGVDGPCEDRLYSGSERQLSVEMPRLESVELVLDGVLDEPEWEGAATLTDFTQFEPSEGQPASERTEVLLFYTPQALYLGIRAHAADPSRLRATLADRDNILRDDHVQILLDTFNDRRRAYALYLNPLGIQQDGMMNESAGRRREEQVDFNPDFLFDSRGRVTPEGYVIEVRIPFKSLKFAAADEQTWGINVIRQVAATGAEESWAPLSRNHPSRLAQSGSLVGIRELRPGMLLEVNPVATGKREGSLQEDEFTHGDFQPDFGVNLKYGLTSNLTLDATYNPDFSQVEADAGEITVNERFAISFPEKRPFFLEGADIFSTPEPLVYTRAIVDPIAGAKLTGKVGALTVGYLGAVDESPLAFNSALAPDPSRAAFHIARLQRDVGDGGMVGLVLTDREAAGQYNRVAGLDGRIRFGGLYTWQFQAANAWTQRWRRDAAGTDTAIVDGSGVAVSSAREAGHLLLTSVDRTGRHWGFRLQAKDIPADFRAQSGFVRRTGVTDFFLFTRYTWFGRPGALFQSWGPWLMANRIYGGRDFWRGDAAEEGMARLRMNFSLRGNTRIVLGYGNQFFVLDPDRYARYATADGRTGDELVAAAAEHRGLDSYSLELNSSYFKAISFGGELTWQETPIFAEGTRGREWTGRGEFQLRPTGALRVEGNLRYSRIHRASDGSFYSQALLPRLKLEYQLSRAVFVRAVGQYSVEEVDVLRTPQGEPYLIDGRPFRIRGGQNREDWLPQTNPLRYDVLFSYEPSPGTVVFLGYGREMTDNEAFRFSPLEPRADGFFVKLSYLFRS